jgi:hypothetical protein
MGVVLLYCKRIKARDIGIRYRLPIAVRKTAPLSLRTKDCLDGTYRPCILIKNTRLRDFQSLPFQPENGSALLSLPPTPPVSAMSGTDFTRSALLLELKSWEEGIQNETASQWKPAVLASFNTFLANYHALAKKDEKAKLCTDRIRKVWGHYRGRNSATIARMERRMADCGWNVAQLKLTLNEDAAGTLRQEGVFYNLLTAMPAQWRDLQFPHIADDATDLSPLPNPCVVFLSRHNLMECHTELVAHFLKAFEDHLVAIMVTAATDTLPDKRDDHFHALYHTVNRFAKLWPGEFERFTEEHRMFLLVRLRVQVYKWRTSTVRSDSETPETAVANLLKLASVGELDQGKSFNERFRSLRRRRHKCPKDRPPLQWPTAWLPATRFVAWSA